MSTKDTLPFKDKHDAVFINSTLNDQYNNLNLNQKLENSSNAFSKSSKSVSTENRKLLNNGLTAAARNLLDFETNDTKKDSHSWKKASKDLSSNLGNNFFETENELKNEKSSTINGSTLSLHIAAYEKMAEDLSDFGRNEVEKEKDAKQPFGGSTFVFENPLEFPRQQENGQSQKPEIGQFKASQRLFNPKQSDQANHQRPLIENNGELRRAVAKSKVVEYINIEDNDVQRISPPPAKKTKRHENRQGKSNSKTLCGTSSKVNNIKKSPKAVASYDDLLDKVYDHVHSQVASKRDLGRKVMDIMLAAINQEVLNDPHSVRKLIIDKQLVLPNTISHPPSMYVHLLIEHDPEHLLTRIIQKLFGEEKPKESEQERLEKLRFKREFAAPAMTRVVAQIGQELVQEYTYGDIVHARNLPDMPKDIEGYKRVAEQLKPVWQSLKEKNAPYKSKYHVCRVCRFKTDSLVAFSKHQWTLHYDGKKYSCTMCPEFNNNVARIRKHYMDKHEIVPTANEEPSNRLDCPICEEDFKFKGELNNHLKDCKRQALSQRRILHPTENDKLAINQWLWTKPTLEPRVARTQPKPPQQPPKPVKQPVHVAPPHRPTLSAGPSHSRPPTLPSAAAASGVPQNITQLMPLIQSLNANPAALEKIKNEHPQVYRQLQTQLANLRNNPQALAQFRTMTPPVRPSTQARKTTASDFPPPGGYSASTRAPVLQRAVPPRPALIKLNCEICDQTLDRLQSYLEHMQHSHKKLEGKTLNDMSQGAPLACSKCKDRFWCYDGLERHLVMAHGLVTQEFLRKAQNKQDGGRCQICKKQYAFNMLQHLVQEHNKNLCSAEIRYSCDVCQFSCTVYQELEEHLSTQHPKKGPGAH